MKSDHGTRGVCSVLWGYATAVWTGVLCNSCTSSSCFPSARTSSNARDARPPLPHTTRMVGSRSRSGVLRVRVLGGCAFFGVLGPTARGLQGAGLGRGSRSAPVGCVSYLLGTQIKIRVSRTITTCAMNAKHCEWPTMAIRERSDTKAMTIPRASLASGTRAEPRRTRAHIFGIRAQIDADDRSRTWRHGPSRPHTLSLSRR